MLIGSTLRTVGITNATAMAGVPARLRSASSDSRRTSMNTRRIAAFTLIELMLVVVLIAMLISILAPAASRARSASQRLVSLSNLRQGAAIIAGYSSDHRDEFLNPFAPGRGGIHQPWVWMQNQPDGTRPGQRWGWAYGAPFSLSGSESFGYKWMPHSLYHDDPLRSRLAVTIAPNDAELRHWVRNNTQENAQSWLEWIFPTSYWYPPVFWQSPDRFAAETRPSGDSMNSWWFRRNRLPEAHYPSKKVLLMECKDFASRGRPMWNSVVARPQVACVDGSGMAVVMSNIYRVTSDIHVKDGPGSLAAPSGTWSPAEMEMSRFMKYGADQGFEWKYGNPAFFWATRDGIRGRDLP
jgi:type II secretory pathway pseudopilin PulG